MARMLFMGHNNFLFFAALEKRKFFIYSRPVIVSKVSYPY